MQTRTQKQNTVDTLKPEQSYLNISKAIGGSEEKVARECRSALANFKAELIRRGIEIEDLLP